MEGGEAYFQFGIGVWPIGRQANALFISKVGTGNVSTPPELTRDDPIDRLSEWPKKTSEETSQAENQTRPQPNCIVRR